MLTKEEVKRYSRQLLLEQVDEDGQHNIANAHAVVIGLGGLGSLVSRFLVGAGVGKLTLVDGDVVAISNLQRQVAYNERHLGDLKTDVMQNELKKVRSNVDITVKSLFADSDNLPLLLSDATCVLDCTDHVRIRKQINAACAALNIPLFIAAASGVSWQAINLPHDGGGCGCYACLVTQVDVREDCTSKGILGPVVGIAACHQATQALLFLAKRNKTAIQWGKYVVADAMLSTMQSFHLRPSPHCEVCQ